MKQCQSKSRDGICRIVFYLLFKRWPVIVDSLLDVEYALAITRLHSHPNVIPAFQLASADRHTEPNINKLRLSFAFSPSPVKGCILFGWDIVFVDATLALS
jgi:hypothetical protein